MRGPRHASRLVLAVICSSAMLAVLLPSAGAVEVDHPLASERRPGLVSSFGSARPHGPGEPHPGATAIAATPSGRGYWIASHDGVVTAHGDARHRGDAGGLALRSPIVDIAATESGRGYWLLAADGGVFTFGDAPFLGSVPTVLPPGALLARPVVAMTVTPTGDGYWIFAADGGVFTFGDAPFLGSVPGQLGPGRRLAGAITDATATASGEGYWLAGDDGGVFSFGTATFHGSAAGTTDSPVVAIVAGASGYLLAQSSGIVTGFGAAVHGDAAALPGTLTAPVVSMAATQRGGYWLLYGDASRLGPGDQGAAVTELQRRLVELGYWLGAADGRYGGLTGQAVMAFQKWTGLPRTGVADPTTLAHLDIADRPTPATTDGEDVIEVDLDRQLVLVVRNGRVTWAFNASSGSGVPYQYAGRWYHARTPTGRYTVSFERPVGWRISHLGALWRPKYFNGGIAFHGSHSVPAGPASHGCVRLSIGAMDHVYDAGLMPIGTAVWVYRDRAI